MARQEQDSQLAWVKISDIRGCLPGKANELDDPWLGQIAFYEILREHRRKLIYECTEHVFNLPLEA
jgi:hypothetical protein